MPTVPVEGREGFAGLGEALRGLGPDAVSGRDRKLDASACVSGEC